MRRVWRQAGFADFRQGTFGNGGQNLYVSRAGILQRIHRFDLNGDGYADLLFVNSQDFNERPPAYLFPEPLGAPPPVELPTLGGYDGALADLNGDGYDDLVIAHQCNGTHSDIAAFVYYGCPEGMSERYKVELPAPNSRAVAIGDFNGDGRPDIAFASEGKLRIFYQTPAGFIPGEYADLNIEVTHLAAADLDDDGCAELYARVRKDRPRVFWGGPAGIQADRFTPVGGHDAAAEALPGSTPGWMVYAEGWRPKIVRLGAALYLFRPEEDDVACFYPVRGREIGVPLRLACAGAVAAAAGDIDGDGEAEIVVAVCRDRNAAETSWVFRDGLHHWPKAKRIPLPTTSARDVACADLNGDGCAEIIVTQGRTDILNTTASLIFRGAPSGLDPDPVRLVTHDATTALVGRTGKAAGPEVIFINHVTGRVRGDVPVFIYRGGPDGFRADRRQELPAWSAPDATCSDFNDDGWADLFIGNCSENAPQLDPGSYLYWGGPDGFHPDRKTVIPTFRAHGSAAGDFRHSGFLDIAVGGFNNPELLIFRGGPGGFDLERPQRIIMDPDLKAFRNARTADFGNSMRTEYWNPRWLFAADFNNDGWLDLFVSQICGPRSLILWGGPKGFSMARATWLSVEGAACAQAADLTGNGWLDLIVGGHQALSKTWRLDSYVYIYWGGPEGYREDRRSQLPAHACNSLTVADFNRDGILDIFATAYNSGRDRDLDGYIYWGKPGGHYSAENRSRLFGHSGSGCLALDFNEDGWVDLAVAHHKTYGNHTGYSKIWWNGPGGFSPQRVTKLPTLGPHGMLSVDPGNIMDRGPEEYFVSSAHRLERTAEIRRIGWTADIQKMTWVKAQVRSALTRAMLAQGNWVGPGGPGSLFENGQDVNIRVPGGWLQYRLALGAVNGGNSPRVRSVEVEYDDG